MSNRHPAADEVANQDVARDAPASTHGEETAPPPADWRARLRGSRFGTVLVLGITTALVLVGVYVVKSGDAEQTVADSAMSAGATAVEVTGAQTGPPPTIGGQANDFTAATVTGETLTLSELRGRPVWITFGASWCTSCRVEAPDIEAAYQQHKAAGLEVVGVYLKETPGQITSFTQRAGLTYPGIADPETTIASSYRVMGIPAHYFVDREGIIRSMHVGVLSEQQIAGALATIL